MEGRVEPSVGYTLRRFIYPQTVTYSGILTTGLPSDQESNPRPSDRKSDTLPLRVKPGYAGCSYRTTWH